MKHKKFMMKEQEKVMGAEVMLTETANAIEQAQADVKVFEAMK